MTRILSVLFAAIITLSLSMHADAAQRRRQKAEPPPPPPQFKVDGPTKAISIAQVKNNIPVGTQIGKVGNGCSIPGPGTFANILSDDAFAGIRVEEYFNAFSAEAGAAGYRLAGTQSGDLFSSQETAKPDLLIGAIITELREDACQEALFSVYRQAKSVMKVEWQVFDPLEKKIVFRGVSEGKATSRVNDHTALFAVTAARDAFRNAAKLVVADPGFLAAVRAPGGAAVSSDSLFPEATTTSKTEPVQIARIPLSTGDFRSQVNTLRDQVITILTPAGSGSGFYISNNLLLTNHHVISGYTDVRVNFFGGRQTAGTVIASDARRDIALVRTEAQTFAGLPLRLENPEVASQVFVIGSPLDPKNEGSVSSGIVSGFRDHDYGPMVQSDVGVTFGNSGGPMFDDKGNVIALTDIGLPDQNGNNTQVNLFIPIADGLKKLNIEVAPASATAQK